MAHDPARMRPVGMPTSRADSALLATPRIASPKRVFWNSRNSRPVMTSVTARVPMSLYRQMVPTDAHEVVGIVGEQAVDRLVRRRAPDAGRERVDAEEQGDRGDEHGQRRLLSPAGG